MTSKEVQSLYQKKVKKMIEICCLLLIGYAVVTGSVCIVDRDMESYGVKMGGYDRRLSVKGLSPTCTGLVHKPRGC